MRAPENRHPSALPFLWRRSDTRASQPTRAPVDLHLQTQTHRLASVRWGACTTHATAIEVGSLQRLDRSLPLESCGMLYPKRQTRDTPTYQESKGCRDRRDASTGHSVRRVSLWAELAARDRPPANAERCNSRTACSKGDRCKPGARYCVHRRYSWSAIEQRRTHRLPPHGDVKIRRTLPHRSTWARGYLHEQGVTGTLLSLPLQASCGRRTPPWSPRCPD